MIKLTFCVRRRANVSEAEFHDYWLNQHGPLVKSLSRALNIARYVQSHALDVPANQGIAAARGAPERFDGIAELWWENEEALAASGATPEGRAAGKVLLEDEAKFIDLENSPLWFNQEHVILDNT